MTLFELSNDERRWIRSEIESTVESFRTDGKYDSGVTFRKTCFDEGDYVKYKIKMLEVLYKKLGWRKK